MKTTVDIPDKLLEDAVRYSGARTKREAILAALEEYNRRQRVEEFLKLAGTFEGFMTQEDLRKMRETP